MENKIRVAPVSPIHNLPRRNDENKNNRRKNKKPENQSKEDQAFILELRKKMERYVSRDQRIHRRK